MDALAGAGGAPSRADERRAACPGGGAGGDFLGSRRRAALRATNTRPRKFYATRHTFITQTLKAGAVSIKKVADYCGTSVEMIEKPGRYSDGGGLVLQVSKGKHSINKCWIFASLAGI